jgi:hypothetical protein
MSGPLDELFDALRAPDEELPQQSVHVRALAQDATDHRAWVLAVWSDPGGAVALHRALRPRVEATLLAELSRGPAELRERPERDGRFDALRLAVFADLDVEPAVRAFGLGRADAGTPAWRQALAHLRHEAQLVGAGVPDEPASVWEARIAHAGRNDALERALRAATPDEVWGAAPGKPAARLAAALREAGLDSPSPDLAGLRALEDAVCTRGTDVIRWIPPLVFQALCDHVAVAVQKLAGRSVEWAECTAEDGLTPPPLVRVSAPDGFAHVPLGVELLRWCMMPLRPGENAPPLADWVKHAFG